MDWYFNLGLGITIIFWIGGVICAAMQREDFSDFIVFTLLTTLCSMAVFFAWPLVLVAGLIYLVVTWVKSR